MKISLLQYFHQSSISEDVVRRHLNDSAISAFRTPYYDANAFVHDLVNEADLYDLAFAVMAQAKTSGFQCLFKFACNQDADKIVFV